MAGFILLFRRSIDSEVFSDPYLWHLFSWCLLKANYKDKTYRGTLVSRGSFVCGRHSAAEQLGIAGSTWYERMKKLEAMGCITIESNSRFTVITVEKYEQYQSLDGDSDNHPTTNRQPSDNEPTTIRQPSDNEPTQEKQGNKETKKQSNKGTRKRGRFKKPTLRMVQKFVNEHQLTVDVENFMDHYNSNGWKVGPNSMKCWKSCVRNWARRDHKRTQPAKTFQQQKNENTRKSVSVVAPAIKAGMTFDEVYDMNRKFKEPTLNIEDGREQK